VATAVIIEDDILSGMALAQLLRSEGYAVEIFSCTDPAYVYCANNPPDVLITDWCVPGELSTGELAVAIRALNPNLRVIFISGRDSLELRELVQGLKGAECLAKPIRYDRFIADIGN
jgi:sigma-B regulation protein RsbU (phosphoserine phosphatase)